MKDARTAETMTMGQRLSPELFIDPVSLPAVSMGESVDVDIERYAENDEPEGEKLPGKPEMKGEIEEGMGREQALPPRAGQKAEQELETEGHPSPADENGEDDRDFSSHVPFPG